MARERIAKPGEPTDHATIFVCVRPEVKEEVRRMAKRQHTSMQALFREALAQYMAKHGR